MVKPKFKVRSQKVIIEFNSGDWLVLFDDSSVSIHGTPEQAMRAIQKAATRGNKEITVTQIEWRNVPAGFVPPKGAL